MLNVILAVSLAAAAVTMTVHYTMPVSAPLAVCVLQISSLQEVTHEHAPVVSTVHILLV